ncbi:MAG: GntR family transcriptional regulator [Proteobacteria bacterium]|nr:GntR family transcriptional regulator [Pseudomonadota bacterium]
MSEYGLGGIARSIEGQADRGAAPGEIAARGSKPSGGMKEVERTYQRPIGRPKGTGSQRVYEEIRARILSLKMPPGSAIDENALVGEFGLSRTPVREALIRLENDGYVTLQPNRGASVSPLDIEEIPELLEAMELCLRATSRWAAQRRTVADIAAMKHHQDSLEEATRRDDFGAMSEANGAFHRAVAASARNRHLTRLYESLLPQYHRLSLSLFASAKASGPFYKKYFGQVSAEHRQLIRAIVAGDPAKADKLAQAHAKLIGRRLEAYVWSSLSNPMAIFDAAPRKPRPIAAPRPRKRRAAS